MDKIEANSSDERIWVFFLQLLNACSVHWLIKAGAGTVWRTIKRSQKSAKMLDYNWTYVLFNVDASINNVVRNHVFRPMLKVMCDHQLTPSRHSIKSKNCTKIIASSNGKSKCSAIQLSSIHLKSEKKSTKIGIAVILKISIELTCAHCQLIWSNEKFYEFRTALMRRLLAVNVSLKLTFGVPHGLLI